MNRAGVGIGGLTIGVSDASLARSSPTMSRRQYPAPASTLRNVMRAISNPIPLRGPVGGSAPHAGSTTNPLNVATPVPGM